MGVQVRELLEDLEVGLLQQLRGAVLQWLLTDADPGALYRTVPR